MRASASGWMLAVAHQHDTAKLPADAGAHAFQPPHSGQIRLASGDASVMPQACPTTLADRSGVPAMAERKLPRQADTSEVEILAW